MGIPTKLYIDTKRLNKLEKDYYYHLLCDNRIVRISYKIIPISWQDGFTGEELQYYPTFTAEYFDGSIEHVEVVYPRKPLTKYLYAQNLSGWRMITSKELLRFGIQPSEKIKWW